MRVRFQADADLDGRIIRGLRRTSPEVNIRTAADAGLQGLKDPDRRTMPAHFAGYVNVAHSSGSIYLIEKSPIAD